jgi:alpha-tubulin suppressor-like RCC1 family protein
MILGITSTGEVHYFGPKINRSAEFAPHLSCLQPVVLNTDGVAMRSVAASDSSALFISAQGNLFAWGHNKSNMLCLDRQVTKTEKIIPVPFVGDMQTKSWKCIALGHAGGGAVDSAFLHKFSGLTSLLRVGGCD